MRSDLQFEEKKLNYMENGDILVSTLMVSTRTLVCLVYSFKSLSNTHKQEQAIVFLKSFIFWSLNAMMS